MADGHLEEELPDYERELWNRVFHLHVPISWDGDEDDPEYRERVYRRWARVRNWAVGLHEDGGVPRVGKEIEKLEGEIEEIEAQADEVWDELEGDDLVIYEGMLESQLRKCWRKRKVRSFRISVCERVVDDAREFREIRPVRTEVFGDVNADGSGSPPPVEGMPTNAAKVEKIVVHGPVDKLNEEQVTRLAEVLDRDVQGKDVDGDVIEERDGDKTLGALRKHLQGRYPMIPPGQMRSRALLAWALCEERDIEERAELESEIGEYVKPEYPLDHLVGKILPLFGYDRHGELRPALRKAAFSLKRNRSWGWIKDKLEEFDVRVPPEPDLEAWELKELLAVVDGS